MKIRILLSLMLIVLLVQFKDVSGQDQIIIHDLKNDYKTGEIMNFSLEHPMFCGQNVFAVEDIGSGARIWEAKINIGCETENEFIDRTQIQHITTAHAKPGGLSLHADPVISSYEGTFLFVYEGGGIQKEMTYQVYETLPLHLDEESNIRIALLGLGYLAIVLYLFKDELSARFRR